MLELYDYLFHDLDKKIFHLVEVYDYWVYAILFAVIFIETGLVIWPFLPGDSLLFCAGIVAAQGSLSLPVLIVLLIIAAVLGDNTNYYIGRFFGHRVTALKYKGKPIVKQQWLDQTHAFYEKYGTRTIVMARFVPIVRTIAPFVAGVGRMNYRKFLPIDIIGGVIWISLFTVAGYLLGNIQWVKDHVDLIAIGIVFVSVLPMVYQIVKAWIASRKNKKQA
jgi:membrane-associated protein